MKNIFTLSNKSLKIIKRLAEKYHLKLVIRFLNWARFTYEDNLRFHKGLDELILEDLKKL